MELGKKIAALRKMQGVTQAQLADYLMVQPQTVSRWESEGGTPDVSFLPKIALFFGVSMDELFGMTDMEQIDNLVYKYSVLRDEKSFEEVMRSLDIAIHSVEEELTGAGGTTEEKQELAEKKMQLCAWKVHVYIQKSRKAQEEAEALLDRLLASDMQSPLDLALKLQKQQFMIQKGEGRAVLQKVQKEWETEKSTDFLHCYMAALMELDRAKDILRLWEQDDVQNIVTEVNVATIPLWSCMFWAVTSEEKEELFQLLLGQYRTKADVQAVFEAEWVLAGLLKKLGKEKEKEEIKRRLLETLERLSLNEYLKMNYIKQIQEL